MQLELEASIVEEDAIIARSQAKRSQLQDERARAGGAGLGGSAIDGMMWLLAVLLAAFLAWAVATEAEHSSTEASQGTEA